MICLSGRDDTLKLSTTDLSNAKEIDILDEDTKSLIEIRIENKTPASLAFCDRNFDTFYRKYATYNKIFIGSKTRNSM